MAKLLAHVLDGKTIGVDVFSWSVSTPFKIIKDNESTPLGYTEISSVKNWWDYGMNLNRDFLYVRDAIKKEVTIKAKNSVIGTLSSPPSLPSNNDSYLISENATDEFINHEGFIATYKNNNWVIEPVENVGYRLCNSIERKICAELKIGSQVDHFVDYGVPVIVDYGVDYHRKSIEVRDERMLRVTVEIYNRLPANSYQVLVDLTAGPLGNIIDRYKEYGVKGTVEDFNVDFNPSPTPGICDYILARAPFDGNYIGAGLPAGLKLKNWNPIDSSNIEEFANEIQSILLHGYYTNES